MISSPARVLHVVLLLKPNGQRLVMGEWATKAQALEDLGMWRTASKNEMFMYARIDEHSL